ncbi:MAG: histidine ammonia-lyase, partial [Alistipes sp.]|nr:histidine ammonia-lyase [Alistipes sp.]
MELHYISAEHLSIGRVREILEKGLHLALSDDARRRIVRCREYLDRKMENPERPIYGITTGFGSLCNISVGRDDLAALQKNLVMSHACGTGERVPAEVVRLILLLKIQSLAYGHSGVQLATVERLIDFFNNDILPVIYQQGSLGASGDLAPLAHMSLPLLGLGEVEYEGAVRDAAGVLSEMGWQPIELQSKEGLALLNGTQFMSAYGVWSLIEARKLSEWADAVGALSLEAFDGRIEPFCEQVHAVRPHKGQIATARNFRRLLEDSEIIVRPKQHVQDPYSFRCIPQVHGASKDTIDYIEQILTTEINSATDNPTVFPDEDMVVSAGNFHGQPIALAMDFLAVAVAELANISERRIYKLISGTRGLPSFLVAKPGLNSGFMIPQYAAASIVSQSKGLCMPASVDSIPSSQGQEDHVSMGSNAATKLYRVVANTRRVLAVELFNGAEAFEFRSQLLTSPVLERLLA